MPHWAPSGQSLPTGLGKTLTTEDTTPLFVRRLYGTCQQSMNGGLMVVSGPVYVLQTFYAPAQHPVHGFRIECGWEPTVMPVSQRLVFLTSDKEVYADALDCEGMPVKVMVTWHRELTWMIADRLQLASWVDTHTATRKEG